MAVGTELLLGQIADTNSAWLGEHLAANGVSSHFHQAVGDNHDRIVLALRTALARSDGVIMCGGLGPTQDDITREAIAEVMNVPLVRDQEIVDRIAAFFRGPRPGRCRRTTRARPTCRRARPSSRRSPARRPGLICPVGNKVVYAVPGVPYEMAEMFERAILPDLRARMAETGEEGVIASRVLRTWGASESGLAESLQDRIDALDAAGDVTLAFLASGIEGIKVRITARARTLERRHRAARQGGGRGPPRHRRAPRRHRVRRRRRVDGGRRRQPPDRPRPDLRRGRVAHRRPHRLPPRQRARRVGLVPRRRRRLRRRQVKFDVLGRAGRAGGHRGGGGGHGRGGPQGDRRRRGPRASPGWPGPTTRRVWRPGPSSSASPCPTGRPRPASCGCPATGNGCASTGPFRPLTCCDAPSTPLPPDPVAPGARSQEAHSRVTLGRESGARLWFAREVCPSEDRQRTPGPGG